MQFKSFEICPTESNFDDNEGTSKVLGNDIEGVRDTFLAPVTECFSPFAFIISSLCGVTIPQKSFGSYII
jgi:hypothetical protein